MKEAQSPDLLYVKWIIFLKKKKKNRGTHLHLELKVLVLPLSAENVTRNANFNGLLEAGGACPQRTGDQVLQRKSQKGRDERRRKRFYSEENQQDSSSPLD